MIPLEISPLSLPGCVTVRKGYQQDTVFVFLILHKGVHWKRILQNSLKAESHIQILDHRVLCSDLRGHAKAVLVT